MPFTVEKEDFSISTDNKKLDIFFIHQYLSKEAYWCKNIPLEIVKRSIENSLCFGIYHHEKQIGFARVVTDKATFAYLADVFIITDYRGRGLSKWLMQTIMDTPDLQGLRRWLLATLDAHGLYTQFDFKPLPNPERFMSCSSFTEYPPIVENK
jgi:GNAT superfamily N-acetyltransferase